MINDLTAEEKEMIKKNIEAFKVKIHWELDNSDDDVLIFGNNRISTTTGDMRKVLFKLAIMLDQMGEQSGLGRKAIYKELKSYFKLVDMAKANKED